MAVEGNAVCEPDKDFTAKYKGKKQGLHTVNAGCCNASRWVDDEWRQSDRRVILVILPRLHLQG